MKALEISSVKYSYDCASECALQNFSLVVTSGEVHALLGPNGAGKSTLMRIITGQLRGYTGGVFIYNRAMPDKNILPVIGYAPQPISLYTALSALENLRFFGAMAGLPEHLVNERSQKVLEETMLSAYAKNSVATYSGGMLRRLNLAVALLHEPRLLLLDEPTAGVDPQSRHHIYKTLNKLNAGGMTILLCTHIMEEAQRLCSRVTMVDRGVTVFAGEMAAIDNLEKLFLEKTGHGLRDE